MRWNGHFDWAASDFQFVEIFAGAGHTSHQWSGPYQNATPCMHAYMHFASQGNVVDSMWRPMT